MTQGELLYLFLTLATFGVFAATLAYFDGVAHKRRRQVVPAPRQPAAQPDSSHAHAR